MTEVRESGGVEHSVMHDAGAARADAAPAPACSTTLPQRLGKVLLVLILVGIVGAWAAQAKPSWWRPPEGAVRGGFVPAARAAIDRDDTAMNSGDFADNRARALEQGLASEFTRVRPDGEQWAIRVLSADANAWLGLRLPQWLAHDRELPWPKGVDLVQIHFSAPDRLTLGAERGSLVWSATMRTKLVDGNLVLEPVGGALGRLWLPWLGASESGEGALSIAAIVPELAAPVPAILELPDGRRVKLLDLEFDDGEARLLFETLPR